MIENKCAVCGNCYDKSFTVTMGGLNYEFDSFECAIHKLAPECSSCQMKIIGHGVESDGRIFCGAHCARTTGNVDLTDRIDHVGIARNH